MASAWDLIGFDGSDGEWVRVVGGSALYEAVCFNDWTDGEKVQLRRLDVRPDGLREIVRYVDPDAELEIIKSCNSCGRARNFGSYCGGCGASYD